MGHTPKGMRPLDSLQSEYAMQEIDECRTARDRAWCCALIDTLTLDETAAVLASFNKIRTD